MNERRTKVSAYAVCLQQDRVLLARYVSPDETQRHWTLPGGKIEHGEDPFDAVVREVAEETGYQVDVERLLGVDSRIGGSSDLADWVALTDVPSLERASIVDVGLELERILPLSRHTNPVPVNGLLRHQDGPWGTQLDGPVRRRCGRRAFTYQLG